MLVVDGARPAEIGNGLMPNLPALRDGGMSFPRARSLPVMETLPNHVMMMTGVRPDRSHVPANTVLDRDEQVLSKEYPFGIFGRRATYRREPAPVVPVSGHAPDAFTMDTAIGMVETLDPNLVL